VKYPRILSSMIFVASFLISSKAYTEDAKDAGEIEERDRAISEYLDRRSAQ
jgi:hypothetical protein